MDLKKFNPSKLPNASLEELQSLGIDDIKELSLKYPYMSGELLIQKANGLGVASPATYKSLYSLLKSGHKFKIVGIKNKNAVPSKPVKKVISDFVKPEQSLFTSEVVNEIPIIHLSDEKPIKKSK
jgi:hypothetical protein